MDRLSPEERSRNMARIRGAHTGPEMLVRQALRRMRVGYRLHRRDLPGRPDIVLASRKTLVFVHGCFWHRHPGCRFAYLPKSRTEFWAEKFRRNVERDAVAAGKLNDLGWRVEVVWECETRSPEVLAERLQRIVSPPGESPND